MRILHVSDLHFPVRFRHVPLLGWFGKRALGMGNYLLGRGKYYAEAHRKVKALVRLRDAEAVDLVICTGDYTGLGSEKELQEAREAVAPLTEAPLGFVTVPGNHDLYITDTWKKRRFDHYFAAFLESDLPEAKVDGTPWPLVRYVGDDVAVVAVNSASPRPFWTSNGKIPSQEVEALARLLRTDAFAGRFVFVITHYAARIEDGQPDSRHHGLLNADAFLEAVAPLDRGALLCGHVHRRFTTRIDGVSIPLFCAGSTTKDGSEGLWVYDVDADGGRATPGIWAGTQYELLADASVPVG